MKLRIKLKVKLYSLLLMFILTPFFVIPAATAAESGTLLEQSLYIWRLVNDVRQHPVQSLSALGIDVDAIREQLGEESFLLDRRFPPLALDLNLYKAAEQRSSDMIKNGHIDYTTFEGELSLEPRISSCGYNAVQAGESVGALTFDTYQDAFDSARVILINMIKDELFSDYPRNYRIFSDIFTEMGVSMQPGYLSIDNSASEKAYIVAMDFALPLEKRSYIIGNTVKSSSNSGIFDLENAAGGVQIVFNDIFIDTEQNFTSTATLGAFEFLKNPSSSGYMILKALNQDGSCNTLKILQEDDENELYDLIINNSASASPTLR